MSSWGGKRTGAPEVGVCARDVVCFVCQERNRGEMEFCNRCRAPLALSLQADNRKRPIYSVAVLGQPGCGKTVYLGMLTDMLSRQQDSWQSLIRGAFSVSLQQQVVGALARRAYPPRTAPEPEEWNWVHCEIAGRNRRKPLELVIPDIAGEALIHEVDEPESFPVIRSFVAQCATALILIDTEALEHGGPEQEHLAVKMVNLFTSLAPSRKREKTNLPVAVLFAKADCCLTCPQDPEEYAKRRMPGLWRHCENHLGRCRFFAASIVGASATFDIGGQKRSVPLRIEPRGIVEPFIWLLEHLPH